MATRFLRQKYACAASGVEVSSESASSVTASPPVPTKSEQAVTTGSVLTITSSDFQAITSLFLLSATPLPPLTVQGSVPELDSTGIIPQNIVQCEETSSTCSAPATSTNMDLLKVTPVHNVAILPLEEQQKIAGESRIENSSKISDSPVLPTRKQRGVVGRPSMTKRPVATINGKEIVLSPIQIVRKTNGGNAKKREMNEKQAEKRMAKKSRPAKKHAPEKVKGGKNIRAWEPPTRSVSTESSHNSSSEFDSSSEYEPSNDRLKRTKQECRRNVADSSKVCDQTLRKRRPIANAAAPCAVTFERNKISCVQCDCQVLERSNPRTSRVMLLLIHAKAHTDKKQFKCSECDYTSDHQIQRHMRKVHTKAIIINQLDDNLRRQWLNNAIKCFPSRADLFRSWYEKSSK